MAYTLAEMRKKVRSLTKSPSSNQLTDIIIDEQINNFYVQTMPLNLQLQQLKTTMTFYTKPNVGTYSLKTIPTVVDNTVVNTDISNLYNSFLPPVYVEGSEINYYQNKEQFLAIYDYVTASEIIGKGEYVDPLADPLVLQSHFTYTIEGYPIIPGSVNISGFRVGTEGHTYNAISVSDNSVGKLLGDCIAVSTINYDTGAIDVTFNAGFPANGTEITVYFKSHQSTIPQAILYDNKSFTVRPIPDKSYKVVMSVMKKPTTLTLATSSAELDIWWEYIAIGASRNIVFDRLDLETEQYLTAKLKEQELLINRPKLIQSGTQGFQGLFISPLSTNYFNNPLF